MSMQLSSPCVEGHGNKVRPRSCRKQRQGTQKIRHNKKKLTPALKSAFKTIKLAKFSLYLEILTIYFD
jgi:hypothetical protein